MKIYITGTTRGLGAELKRRFERTAVLGEIIGLNRPEYDITDPNPWIPTDFDVFVNNAHAGFSQTELLYSLFEKNKDRDCTIINIGSVSADGDRAAINPYAIQKKALDAACTQLQLVRSNCKVIQVKLGRIDTDMVAHINAPKMELIDISREIINILDSSIGNYYIKTITLDNKI